MSRIMVTADWQLCHKPENEYRWDIFNDIQAIQRKEKFAELWVLGDVVDGKDRLPNALINRLMREFQYLSKEFELIRLLPGNHDFATGGTPGESILCILSWLDRIRVMHQETCLTHQTDNMFLWEPNGKWPDSPVKVDCMLAHQLVLGAVGDDCQTEIGEGAAEVNLKYLERVPLVLSGDVHAAQFFQLPQSKDTTWVYVGAPHHIRFGEEWRPSYVELETSDCSWKHRFLPEKVRFITIDCNVNDAVESDKRFGDKLRVRVHKRRPEEWDDLVGYMRQWEEHGADEVIVMVENKEGEEWQVLEGADSHDVARVYESYCEWKDVPESLVRKGREFL